MAFKFNYNIPTKLYFGKGSLERLKKIKLPGKKALLVTGGTSTITSIRSSSGPLIRLR